MPVPLETLVQKRPGLLLVLVCGLTFLLYAGSLRFDFVYDDRIQILENSWLRSWHFLPRYFVSHAWAGVEGRPYTTLYWRPLFLAWLLLNRILFGVQPLGWHLTTVALHVAVTSLVYTLVRLLGEDRWTAAGAALIFGVHPVTIETAAWVSGATDSLLALFLIPSFLLYLKTGTPSKQRSPLVGSLALYAAALLVKETAIILPLLIIAWAWICGLAAHGALGRRLRTALDEASPYCALTFLYLSVRLFVLHGLGGAQNQASPITILLTWPSLLWLYVRLLVFPAGISAYYDLKLVTLPTVRNVMLPALGLVGAGGAVTLWSCWLRARMKASPGMFSEGSPQVAAFATSWMAITILPVLHLRLLNANDFAHARYLYLPCVGFSILVAATLRRLPSLRPFGANRLQSSALLVLVALLGTSNAFQQVYWTNNLELGSRGVIVAPHNPLALSHLGNVLADSGQYDKAVLYLQAAVQEAPDAWLANVNLGITYVHLGDYRAGEQYLLRATQLWPHNVLEQTALALAQLRLGKLTEAAQSAREATRLNPRGVNLHYLLGLVLEQEGNLPAAAEAFRNELELDPQSHDATTHLQQVQQRMAKTPVE